MRKAPIFKQVLIFANDYLNDNFAYKLEPMPVVSGAVTVVSS